MKKNKLTRFYIWSGLSKIQNMSFQRDEDELEDIEKYVLKIFKSSIKNEDCILLHYKRELENVFELYNQNENFLIRMNVKDNGSLVELLEFPSEFERTKRTSIFFYTQVTERLKNSFECEIISRSDLLYNKFTELESNELSSFANNIGAKETPNTIILQPDQIYLSGIL